MGNSAGNDDLFKKVRDLQLPKGKFVLFGSAPMGIRGIKESHDIDIVVTEDVWNDYRQQDWEVRTVPNGSVFLWKDEIELWKDWKPGEWDVAELIRKAEMIDGLPFVGLDEVVQWKKLKGRQKDLKDIVLIENFVKRHGVGI